MARDESSPIVQQTPTPIPRKPDDLPMYLENELRRMWAAISALHQGHIPKVHLAPGKPRDGDIRYADGTNWNPGSGEGIYAYYAGSWNKL